MGEAKAPVPLISVDVRREGATAIRGGFESSARSERLKLAEDVWKRVW
jgi:hypothetical protein